MPCGGESLSSGDQTLTETVSSVLNIGRGKTVICLGVAVACTPETLVALPEITAIPGEPRMTRKSPQVVDGGRIVAPLAEMLHVAALVVIVFCANVSPTKPEDEPSKAMVGDGGGGGGGGGGAIG